MTLFKEIPFQYERPLFVRKPFRARVKNFKKGDHFAWKEMAIEDDIVRTLFSQGFLHHNEEFEQKKIVGDGLEACDIDGLHSIVRNINDKVKRQIKDEREFSRKKCKYSTIKDKQIGLIRSWRRNFGHLES